MFTMMTQSVTKNTKVSNGKYIESVTCLRFDETLVCNLYLLAIGCPN